jgi:hypothetical protein
MVLRALAAVMACGFVLVSGASASALHSRVVLKPLIGHSSGVAPPAWQLRLPPPPRRQLVSALAPELDARPAAGKRRAAPPLVVRTSTRAATIRRLGLASRGSAVGSPEEPGIPPMSRSPSALATSAKQ